MNKIKTLLIGSVLVTGTAHAVTTVGAQLMCDSEDSALIVTDFDPNIAIQTLPKDCRTLPRGLHYEQLGKHNGAFYDTMLVTFVGGELNGKLGWLFERR